MSIPPSLTTTPMMSQQHTRAVSPREQKEEVPEEPTDIEIDKIKEKGIKEVKIQLKREKRKYGEHTDSFIRPSKEFLAFTNDPMCDEMIVSSIFYVSSTLALTEGPELDEEQTAEQEELQADSLKILSSLYCQLLISPYSSNLPVRTERIFYETLIFFIDACICFAIHTAKSDRIIEIMAKVFRGDIKDPLAPRSVEFLPITEIVKKNWLSQRVPGKNRATIKHSTLRGTTKLVEPLVEIPEKHDRIRTRERALEERKAKHPVKKTWGEDGFPVDTKVPYKDKVIPVSMIVQIPQPKETSEPISTVGTREATPDKKRQSEAK